ncbi:hypothetical protein M899_2584 [Bacteriovorax sp. BSW11_IV]|uniref:hypothetical protein n=1 Tax=Bacteriovorax sp. BSW11_IV TaxID=1353529 RepID=UPI000389F3B1|nr:hypothetical protein [Bacteriovorax sp. BSW11_IV]EQC49884.1 hypothetical protein M899_2584 [Bacteriovorax sp. BSW11_IV]
MKNIVLMLLFCLSSLTFAGHEIGNGGHILKCDDGSYEIYDLFYIKKFWNTFPTPPSDSASEYKMVESYIEPLKEFYPELHKMFDTALEHFKVGLQFENELVFGNSGDIGTVFGKKGCEILQIAVQQYDPVFDRTRFFVDRELYTKLDTFNRSVLIIHELIYYVMKYENAQKVRLFNYAFLNDMFSITTIKYQMNLFKNLNIESVVFKSIPIQINEDMVFDEKGNLLEAKSVKGRKIEFEFFEFYLSGGRIYFYNNASPKEVIAELRFPIFYEKEYLLPGYYKLHFDKDARLIKIDQDLF